MMGRQTFAEPLFHIFCLEDHVPSHHPLRQIDRLVDLGFVREGLAEHYSSIGRPSVDPELMTRMLLFGYLQGIPLAYLPSPRYRALISYTGATEVLREIEPMMTGC